MIERWCYLPNTDHGGSRKHWDKNTEVTKELGLASLQPQVVQNYGAPEATSHVRNP